jgi:polyhydroxyalkanoate synthase subunit PhaC
MTDKTLRSRNLAAPPRGTGKGKTRKRSAAAPAPAGNKTVPPEVRPGTGAKTPAADHRGEPGYTIPDPAEFARNMISVAERSQRLMNEFLRRHGENRAGHPDPLQVGSAFMELLRHMATDPVKLFEAQMRFWRDQMHLWHVTTQRFLGHDVDPVIEPAKDDKRFKHHDWADIEVFNFIKQSYLLSAKWVHETAKGVDTLDEETRRKIDFYTKQFVDALAPTNFALTNPEVLRTTLSSSGENLVKGLENLLEDLERSEGQLLISQTDASKFEVGANVAVTPGKVVYQNGLIQLLQYEPATGTVYRRPLVIFPPWINKFYILDLRPENSFIKWAVSKGYTVFVVSWANPDAELAEKTFEDYMREGVLDALDAVEKATGEREVNAIGYCIGGTLLASTLAWMAKKGEDRIKSATFFAAQTDFTEAGDLKVFIDEQQLELLEEQMQAQGGLLDSAAMAATFNMLRANDLIWSFVIRNYMLGKEPFPFDLLYWNSDSTRMPYRMHLFYLREFYHHNRLARGELELGGERLDLSKVTIPVYLQSSKDDHIAPFPSVYKSTQLFGGPVRFIVAGSGHIAGVINHPDAKKYQYWLNPQLPESVDDWWLDAEEIEGSWWPDWHKWLSKKSGEKVPARKPGDGGLKPIEDAPGSYVKVK